MSSVNAVTEDLKLTVRMASFYHLDEQAKKDILNDVTNAFVENGKKHNFIVWRVSLDGGQRDDAILGL